jgi:hypothetical protein
MINIKNKICEEKDCISQATFNYKNETKRIFCSKHKKDGMINIKSKIPECNILCGYCGSSPSHCAQHKYMINKPKRTCVGNDSVKVFMGRMNLYIAKTIS